MQIITCIVRDNKVVDKASVGRKANKVLNKALGITASAVSVFAIEKGARVISDGIGDKVLGPVVPVATEAAVNAAKNVVGNGGPIDGAGLYRVFSDATLPYFYDLGNAMVLVSFAFASYQLIRKEHKQGFDKIKWTAFGYITLHSVNPFIMFVNKIARGIEDALSSGISGGGM